jgi:hypothetical protein
MPQGYNGLPSYYSGSSNPITPNLGLSLIGMDPIIAEDFVLIDTAFGGVGSSIRVNGSVVNNPNFVNSGSVTFSVIGSNISLTAAGSGGSGFPSRFVTVTSAYVAVAGDFVLCDTSTGGFTVTMPLSSANAKANICVKKISSDQNVLTMATSSADTIDGQSTQMTTQQNTAVLMAADGITTWRIY